MDAGFCVAMFIFLKTRNNFQNACVVFLFE